MRKKMREQIVKQIESPQDSRYADKDEQRRVFLKKLQKDLRKLATQANP